ncbi:hypothetical protein [Burkholderia contaminans]|uniref:hypothetical protein n=1 Tax=Burkholderia contaminans TaxID=488447 RepID=UPI00145389CE|nr:hypothetical protein [Burkholderia contaminans]VWD20204.1 hypothetical protein BCO18442_03859 [Burkholderia contaminans]
MTEREEFEAFALRRDMSAIKISCGRYKSSYTQAMWESWQAARHTTPDRECEWRCDDIDNGIWESSCGESWSFIDGGPVENRMLFCHRCGGKLKTAPNGEKGGAS